MESDFADEPLQEHEEEPDEESGYAPAQARINDEEEDSAAEEASDEDEQGSEEEEEPVEEEPKQESAFKRMWKWMNS